NHFILNINDSAGTGARNVTVAQNEVVGLATITGFGQESALIEYNASSIKSLVINGGSGGNTFTIDVFGPKKTAYDITLNSGTGADIVNVQRATLDVVINGQDGLDTVNVGLNGSAQDIFNDGLSANGSVTITNVSSRTALNIDDSADQSSRTATMTNNGTNG